MSTRCQIRFVFHDGKVLTYQHGDGYPTWTVPNIIDFLKWNKGRNAQYDYVVPNWFYFNKKGSESYCDREYTKDFKVKKVALKNCYALNFNAKRYADDPNLLVKIGYGLDYDGSIHGDIEYFYDIIFAENIAENDDKRRYLSGDFEDTLTFRIECYDIPYDWDRRKHRYDSIEALVANTLPFFTLNIKDLNAEPRDALNKQLEKVEHELSEKSNKEYEDWKAKNKEIAI